MALHGVGKTTIDICCGKKTGGVWLMTVVGDVTLKRDVNSAATLSLTCRRGTITPERGDVITMTVDGEHDMFYGYVTSTRKHSKTVDVTARDQLYYMARNTYTQNYGCLKASDLLIRMCEDFGFDIVYPPNIADTEYEIPDVVVQDAKPLDVIVDALNITYRNTGKRYYVYDAFKNVCLDIDTNPETLKVMTFEVRHSNIHDYSIDEDMEDIVNTAKAHAQSEEDDDQKTFTAEDAASQEQFGKLETNKTVGADEDPQSVAEGLLTGPDPLGMSVSGAIGEPRVIAGSSVHVDLFSNGLPEQREFVRGWFKVESVTHKFSLGTHTMDLELSLIEMEDNWEEAV